MKKQIPYGMANYEELVRENGYFVDKTPYLAELETIKESRFPPAEAIWQVVAYVPSCVITMTLTMLIVLPNYSDIPGSVNTQPTSTTSSLSSSSIFPVSILARLSTRIEHSFKNICNSILSFLRAEYKSLLDDMPAIIMDDPVSDNVNKLLYYLRAKSFAAGVRRH